MDHHGIRLRSDSNGSMKSAFYQGRIVSSTTQKVDDSSQQGLQLESTIYHQHSHHTQQAKPRPNAATLRPAPSPLPPSAGRQVDGVNNSVNSSLSIADPLREDPSKDLQQTPDWAAAWTISRQGLATQSTAFKPIPHPGSIPQPQLPYGNQNDYRTQFLPPAQDHARPPFNYQSHRRMTVPHQSQRTEPSRDATKFVSHKTSLPAGNQAWSSFPLAQPTKGRAVSPTSKSLTTMFDSSNKSPARRGLSHHPVWSQLRNSHDQVEDYGTYGEPATLQEPDPEFNQLFNSEFNHLSSDLSLDTSTVLDDEDEIFNDGNKNQVIRTWFRKGLDWFDPSADLSFDDNGVPCFEDSSKWTLRGMIRTLLYNPVHPEFSTLHQFSWAVLIGILMGMYTAAWKYIIDHCVNFMWKDVPLKLLQWGVFTDLDGSFPLYHYMWIVPSIFGGTLSFIFASLSTPIPGQNEWIHSLHSRGVQDFKTLGLLFVLATAGMTSGLSLGPELPLILTAGMMGSWLAVRCKQSMLQARVLNLTAASAAIGGFFGFPMAGAIFVLEIPHRMGLQYFEAKAPAIFASIIAVFSNRLVTGTDVTGYYEYPFLNQTLPSHILIEAIVYGLFGCALGIFYTKSILSLKHFVHDLFREPHESERSENDDDKVIGSGNYTSLDEKIPLIGKTNSNGKDNRKDRTVSATGIRSRFKKPFSGKITHEPTRAAVTGWLVGLVVGVTCIFIPHVMFWGEAQLQTMIDQGKTPLPIFGTPEEPTGGLVALGFCMESPHEHDGSMKSGFSLGCSVTIVLGKIFVTGLSLGTGIVGGHFWGPLFAGCAAAHFFTDLISTIASILGFSSNLAAYPCVAILCIMGSAHVVVFRAYVGIVLILTLTIAAFDREDSTNEGGYMAGDFSAIAPLLTVAVFVALQLSRRTVFYEKQRSRGDIMALPEVLCEPGRVGRPLVMDYEGNLHELDECDYEYELDEESIGLGDTFSMIDSETTLQDNGAAGNSTTETKIGPLRSISSSECSSTRASSIAMATPSPKPPRPNNIDSRHRRSSLISEPRSLDELLKAPPDNEKDSKNDGHSTMHRRTMSEPFQPKDENKAAAPSKKVGRKSDGGTAVPAKKNLRPLPLKRISSFGEVDQEQPCLLEQARRRAASFASDDERMQKMKHKMSMSSRPVRKNTS